MHDTGLIAALFSLYNRYVDCLASVTPSDPAFYNRLAHILKDKGYMHSENRYADLQMKTVLHIHNYNAYTQRLVYEITDYE